MGEKIFAKAPRVVARLNDGVDRVECRWCIATSDGAHQRINQRLWGVAEEASRVFDTDRRIR